MIMDSHAQAQDYSVAFEGAVSRDYNFMKMVLESSKKSPVVIVNVGLEAEAEFKAIQNKLKEGYRKFRNDTCDDPILCWIAPNRKNKVCPVHGKSIAPFDASTRSALIKAEFFSDEHLAQEFLFAKLMPRIKEGDLKPWHLKRLQGLKPALDTYLEPKPSNTPC